MKKKMFTLWMTGLFLLLTTLRVAAQSQPVPGSTLSWEYIPSTKTLSITGSGDMPDFEGINQPWNAFQTQIETITIGAGVTSVGKNAFLSCAALKSVSLPDGLKTIGVWAFKGCSSLTNLTLPKSVTAIGWLSFTNCMALKDVTVFWDTPLDNISADAFSGSGINGLNKVKLYVPAGKTGAYQAANVWGGFDVQEIPEGTLSTGLHWQYIPSTKTLSITGSGAMPDFNGLDQPWELSLIHISEPTRH